jgi:hypothetical protein
MIAGFAKYCVLVGYYLEPCLIAGELRPIIRDVIDSINRNACPKEMRRFMLVYPEVRCGPVKVTQYPLYLI